MIFRELIIKIDSDKESIDYIYGFKTKCRHVLNFIERTCLNTLKWPTDGFNALGVVLSDKPDDTYIINFSKVLVVTLPFNKKEIDGLDTNSKLFNFVFRTFKIVLEKEYKKYNLPKTEILESFDEFKDLGYKNEWIFTKKKLKDIGTVELHCSLTIDKFELTVLVYHETEIIFKEVILKTDPDELAFESRFKNIEVGAHSFKVFSHLKKKLYEKKFSELKYKGNNKPGQA